MRRCPQSKAASHLIRLDAFEEITPAQEVASFLFFLKSHSGLIGRSHRVFRAFSFICAVFGPNWKQAKGGVTVTQVRALLIKRFECVLWQRR